MHHTIIDQSGDKTIGIDAEVIVCDVLFLLEIKVMAFPIKALFDQRHSYAHGAIGNAAMIKMQALIAFDRLVRWYDYRHVFRCFPLIGFLRYA